MSSSFKVQHIEEQPEKAYDTDMENNNEQQPSTSNDSNEMANNDIIKEAKNALANQEEITKKHQQKARGQPLLERKVDQPIHLTKGKAHHSLMKPQQ